MDNPKDMDYWLAHAIHIIEKDYAETVSVFEKKKDLLKYGQNDEVQTTLTTLMGHKSGTYNETYVATNAIDKFSSSSAGDTTTIIVEGHTVDANGDFTFVTQEVTLAGQTETALTTPLARATRAYASGATDLVGTVYIYEDDTVVAGVPATGSKVHLTIPAGQNQSQKASTTISNTDYWVITSMHAHFLEKAAGYGDVILEVRQKGKVFREVDNVVVSNSAPQNEIHFKPYIIIPANSDVRLRATVDVNGKSVGGSIQGVLLKVT